MVSVNRTNKCDLDLCSLTLEQFEQFYFCSGTWLEMGGTQVGANPISSSLAPHPPYVPSGLIHEPRLGCKPRMAPFVLHDMFPRKEKLKNIVDNKNLAGGTFHF